MRAKKKNTLRTKSQKRRIKPEKRSGLHHPIECTEYAFAYANKKKCHVNWSPFSFFLIFNSRSHGAENAFLLFLSHFYSFASIFFSCKNFGLKKITFLLPFCMKSRPNEKKWNKQRSPSYIYFWLVKCIKCVHAVYLQQSSAFRLIYAA